jgi:kynureninase
MITLAEAQAMDQADPLRGARDAFDLPPGVLYLDGHSLGPPPRRALAQLHACAAEEWRGGLIRSWNAAGWIDLPRRVGARIARLIGAGDDEVIAADSVSVNLFKLAAALLARRPGRALAIDEDEFPTDQFVLEGVARLAGAPLMRLRPGAPAPAGSVLVRSLVHYRTAVLADMAAAEGDAAARGVDVIWDLSHAAGLLPVALRAAASRFAVGCSYKYLNGGPGAPAFLYVARQEAHGLVQPISGWMGAARPFAFESRYAPADGVLRFAAGTPPILALAALDGALDLFDALSLDAAAAKSRALGELFRDRLGGLGLDFVCAPIGRRGGHLCLRHPHGLALMRALIARGVIGDFRAPDLMRFGFSPLFLSYAEVWRAAEEVAAAHRAEAWRDHPSAGEGPVT